MSILVCFRCCVSLYFRSCAALKNILCIMFLYFPKFIWIFAAFLCRRKFMHVYIQECGCHIICVFKHVDLLCIRLSLCVYMNACVCVWMFLLLSPDVITITRLTQAHTHTLSSQTHTLSSQTHIRCLCINLYMFMSMCVFVSAYDCASFCL